MPDKTTRYTVVSPVRFAGKVRSPGEPLDLTAQQATFLRAAGKVRAAEEPAQPASKPARAKKEADA